jgi:hypothetical protein
VADHVHVQDTGLVKLLDNGLGGYTDGRDEQLSTRVDDNIDELVQLALCVVVAGGGLAKDVGGVSHATNNTETSCIGDGSSELGASGDVHARKHYGMLDLKQIGELCAELL